MALSFLQFSFNLAYGGAGLLFAGLSRSLKLHAPHGVSDDAIFKDALKWLP